MKKESAAELLKRHNKRTTPGRVALMELLLGSSKAFTMAQIETRLSGSMDRVTIYRTLQTFQAIGLVFKMIDHKGTCRYMLNLEKHKNLNTHPHLQCTTCGEIICLPSLPDEYLEKLEKYEIDEIYFLMQGKCHECSTIKKKRVTNEKHINLVAPYANT